MHTYRIPGLATINKGTLTGVYDVRHRGRGDLPGDIDVGMSRSIDGGRTWETMRVIMDLGDDPDWNYDGIGAPAILVDQHSGTIWDAATWSHGNRSWIGSVPGLKPGFCLASLINVDQELGKDVGGGLLCSSPDSTRCRHHITIKASSDNGQSWPKEHRLLLDEENSAGYSCMSMIDEKTVGFPYEGAQAQMTF